MCSYKEINEWFKWKKYSRKKIENFNQLRKNSMITQKICGGDNETDVFV